MGRADAAALGPSVEPGDLHPRARSREESGEPSAAPGVDGVGHHAHESEADRRPDHSLGGQRPELRRELEEERRLLGRRAHEHVEFRRLPSPARGDLALGWQRRVPVLGAERHARAQPETGGSARGPRLRGEQVVERGIRGERAGGTTHPLLQSPTSLPDAERPALQDRPGDQSVGSGCHEQVRDRIGARRLPEDRHSPGVAAEPADARTHPAQRLDDVEQAEVRRTPARFAVAEEPEHAEPIGHGDDDDPLLAHERGRIVAADVAGARHVGAAVHPHHDREGFAGPVRRARDRESQAVLVELDTAHRAAEEAVTR